MTHSVNAMPTYTFGQWFNFAMACCVISSSLSPIADSRRITMDTISTGDTTNNNAGLFREYLGYVPWNNTSSHSGAGQQRLRRSPDAEFRDEDKNFILNVHNQIRERAGASNMVKLTWNSALETEALRWATNCDFDHPEEQRSIGGFSRVGQNLFFSTGLPSSKSVLNQWGIEESDFVFITNTCKPGKICGHFTQMVWASTVAVGCAMKFCDPITSAGPFTKGYLVVCEYGPGGNIPAQSPYTKGVACSECPAGYSVCSNKLCATQETTEPTEPTEPDTPDNLARISHDASISGMFFICCYSLFVMVYTLCYH